MQGNQTHSQEEVLEAFELFIDALSANRDIPKPQDHMFMVQFPFMLAGAFDAKGVPVTKQNIEKAFDMIDPEPRESFFAIDPNYSKPVNDKFHDDPPMEDMTPAEKAEFDASFEALKAKLAERGIFDGSAARKRDPVQDIVILALRSDQRFAGLASEEDVLECAKDIVESWARQQIDKIKIPAEHPFWQMNGLHLLVMRHRENTVDTVMQISREQRAQAVQTPEPS